MPRHNRKYVRTIVIVLAAVAFAGAAAAQQAQVTIRKGTCRLVRNGSVLNLKEGIQWRWVEVGDKLLTAEESSAIVKLDGCGEITLGPESAIEIVKMNLPGKKGRGQAEVHHQQGQIQTVLGKPERPGAVGRCELGIRVGNSTVRGSRFGLETAYLEDGRYRASLSAGMARLEHDTGLLALLGSGVTVDDGPPVTITANPSNEFPISLSQVGSVVYALMPGQSVSIEQTDEGFVMTNVGEGLSVHAIEWDGAPAVQIEPGEQRLFPVTETEISAERIRNHTVLLSRVLSETYPTALEGLQRAQSGQQRRVISREDAFNQVLRYPIRRRGVEETSASR